ncbi:hypothetical protein B0O99DRAFT_502107 [Bisporella sp. PMI_857]|nr:hypothetical protein B0O99DRAFT_502107 [Bisporella sp. PMI_857]
MKLCENRPEDFGPSSKLSSPIPTTCFIDAIVIPLPIYVALLLLPLLFLLSLHHRKQNYNPSTTHLRQKKSRNCLFTTTSVIYYGLIIANILMEVLEIVRLSLLKYSIALLPFVFVGLLLGGYLHWGQGAGGRIRGWQAINGILWVGGIVVNSVKVVGLTNAGIHGRKGTKYPVVDQVTDIAVMAGVYAVIAILELVLGTWKAFRKASRHGSEDGTSPVLPSGWTLK